MLEETQWLQRRRRGAWVPNGDLEWLAVWVWHGDLLVGIATCWTDYAHSAYLADLAVASDHQRSGIGRQLVELAHATVGPQVTLILLSAPAAANYYPKIGMERFTDCFIFRRSQ